MYFPILNRELFPIVNVVNCIIVCNSWAMKKLWLLRVYRGLMLPSHIGNIVSYYKDPFHSNSIMKCHVVQWNVMSEFLLNVAQLKISMFFCEGLKFIHIPGSSKQCWIDDKGGPYTIPFRQHPKILVYIFTYLWVPNQYMVNYSNYQSNHIHLGCIYPHLP